MSTTHEMPDPNLWLAPLSWDGSPPRPARNYSRGFSSACSFVRGELIVTMTESIGANMTRETEIALPALIRVEKGKPVDVYAPSPHDTCWTLTATTKGRKPTWRLYEGKSYPAETSIEIAFERAIVQSVLPAEGSRKYISFMIQADGSAKSFSHALDPDDGD